MSTVNKMLASINQSMGSTQPNEKVVTRKCWSIRAMNSHLAKPINDLGYGVCLGIFLCWKNVRHWSKQSCLKGGSGWVPWRRGRAGQGGRQRGRQQHPLPPCLAQCPSHTKCSTNIWTNPSTWEHWQVCPQRDSKGRGGRRASQGPLVLP